MSAATLARQFFDGANARDWGLIASIHSDDHVYHDPQGPPAGIGGEAMAAHLGFYVEALEGRWEVTQVVDAGEYATVRWTGRGTHGNDMIEVPATGRTFAVDAISLFRARDGRIAEHWCVWDTAGLMQQIGVLPT